MNIELGGGPNPKYRPNVDVLHGDIKQDVRQGLPFPDGSVDLIWSSDFFEHLTFEEGLACLRECARVLAPGGMIDFHIPDMAAAFAYHNHGPGTGWGYELEMCCYGDRSSEWQTHKAWYTKDTMRYALEHEGWDAKIEQVLTHGWPAQPKMRVQAWPRR